MAATPPEDQLPQVVLEEIAMQLERSSLPRYADQLRGVATRIAAQEREFKDRVREVLAIHHEVNNALTGVLGNAQLLQMSPAAADPATKKRLDALSREAQRIRDIITILREFRRQLQEEESPASPPIKEAS